MHRLLGDSGRRKQLNRGEGDGGLELNRDAMSGLVFHFLSEIKLAHGADIASCRQQNQLGQLPWTSMPPHLAGLPVALRLAPASEQANILSKSSGLVSPPLPKTSPGSKGEAPHYLPQFPHPNLAHNEDAFVPCYFTFHDTAFVQLGQLGSILPCFSNLLELGVLEYAIGLALEVGDMLPGHLQKGQLL